MTDLVCRRIDARLVVGSDVLRRYARKPKRPVVARSSEASPPFLRESTHFHAQVEPDRVRPVSQRRVAGGVEPRPRSQGVEVQHGDGVFDLFLAHVVHVVVAAQQSDFLRAKEDYPDVERIVSAGHILSQGQHRGDAGAIVAGSLCVRHRVVVRPDDDRPAVVRSSASIGNDVSRRRIHISNPHGGFDFAPLDESEQTAAVRLTDGDRRNARLLGQRSEEQAL